MIWRNSLNETLYKYKFKYSKSRCFLISPYRISIIAESQMFLKRLISCQSFSIICHWFDDAIFTRVLKILIARTDKYVISIRTYRSNFWISWDDFLTLNANHKLVSWKHLISLFMIYLTCTLKDTSWTAKRNNVLLN